jgi:hypothetical protein
VAICWSHLLKGEVVLARRTTRSLDLDVVTGVGKVISGLWYLPPGAQKVTRIGCLFNQQEFTP